MVDEEQSSTRQRILDRLGDIFYMNGTYHVGMAELVDHLGVTRRTFYRHFASKEDLVLAYLQCRDLATRTHLRSIAGQLPGKEAILAIFSDLEKRTQAERFRGCAFLVASVENPQSAEIAVVSRDHKNLVKEFFRDLLHGQAGAEIIAEQLTVLYDGALVGALLRREAHSVSTTLDLVAKILSDEQ